MKLRLFSVALLSSLLAACGGGGGGGGSAIPSASGGGSSTSAQSGNFLPLSSGNSWTYQGGLVYGISAPATVNGQVAYPYQGGCNATEYLVKDSQGNVSSIGQSVSGTISQFQAYPQPELLVRGALSAGMTWQNNLGSIGIETATVGNPSAVTINSTAYTAYPITYTIPGYPGNTETYVAGIGPIYVTDFCVNPPVTRSIISYGVSPSSI